MVPSNPSCCVLIPLASYLPGLDEEILNFRKTWGSKMAEPIPNEERIVERVCSSGIRFKLTLLNILVSINSDIAEQMLSAILKIIF